MAEQQELLNDSSAGKHQTWAIAKAVCRLFCCPPIPSRITAKLAFLPPSPVSYSFVGDEGSMTMFVEGASGQLEPFTPPVAITPFYIREAGQQIAAVHIAAEPSRFTVLFSHGNAVDIGQMAQVLAPLSRELQCSFLCYDYPGYGLSSGTPLESGLYSSVRAAWRCLKAQFGVPASNIILYGQSIGSCPSVDLASELGRKLELGSLPPSRRAELRLGGLVLHSPLMSGIRVVRPQTQWTWCCDPFKNIQKIERVRAPTLIIHGTEDEVVPVSHGYSLHAKCENAVDPLFLESAGHNDVELFGAYRQRLREFVNELSAAELAY